MPSVSASPIVVSASEARRLLMGCQGLLGNPEKRVTAKSLLALIETLGFVQIDSINVVERAHHLTLFSRRFGYRHRHLTRMLEQDRSLFEHWTHDASIIPTKWFHHWKPRFKARAGKIRENRWWNERMGKNPERVIRHVRERVETDGPLMSRDFEHERNGNGNGPWWAWEPQKAALEYLWHTGVLMIAQRERFQKVYDLTSRVLPDHHESKAPTKAQHLEWACRSALERLGVATSSEIAKYWRTISLAEAKKWCEKRAKQDEIVRVIVEHEDGSKPQAAFAVSDWKKRAATFADAPAMTRLMSPFDPVLRDRQRALRRFGFEYRFEAFVPAAKRKYGYYVLPILEGESLIGRLDPKFDRQAGVLRVNGVWWEPKVRVTKKRRAAMEEAVNRLAGFIGASAVEIVG